MSLGRVQSESDERVDNNVVRHEYRLLTDVEKDAMRRVKDIGLAFIQVITAFTPEGRERSLAITKAQEAVMWAVNGVTK